MTLRQLTAMQWVGLALGGGAWAVQLVIGFGITAAECGVAGTRWGISNDTWQAVALAAALACVTAAEAAAITVLVRTRDVSYERGEPPLSRIRFLAIAAVAANAGFLLIVVLSGIGSIVDVACRQA